MNDRYNGWDVIVTGLVSGIGGALAGLIVGAAIWS